MNIIEICSVFTNEKMQSFRNPEALSQLIDFDHPAGLVDENELKEIVGASEVNPQSITATIFCPTYTLM